MESEPETSGGTEAWMSQALTYLAATLSLVVVIKYLFTSSVPANIPPFPARAYPILGHLPYLKNSISEQIGKWTKSTGNVFSLYFGGQLVVILSGYDVVYDGFVKRGDAFNYRPPSMTSSANGLGANKGIFSSTGKIWKEQRTVSLQILRAFGMGKNVLAVKVNDEASAYMDALAALAGEPSDVRTLTRNAIANVICSILLGKRFEYDDEDFITTITKMEEMSQLFTSSSLPTFFPWLRFIPGDLFKANKRRNLSLYLLEFFSKRYIEKTKNEDSDLNQENFISAYLLEKEKLDKQGKDNDLDEEHLTRIIFELFFAGTDTTNASSLWFMVHMLHFPYMQDRIFAEISEVLGTERAPTMQDKNKLNLLHATLMESQRLTIDPLSVPHSNNEDVEFNGYTIPAGTTVLANLHSIFHAGDTWEDPLEFKPERFLDAQGNLLQPPQFLPFGLGRRVCPGESLAKMNLFLFLTSLMQRFELRPAVPGELPSLKPVPGIVYYPQPFKIRFVDRRHL